ncbi:DNA damage-repair/toleration protein DRT100, partial [Linum perenne]
SLCHLTTLSIADWKALSDPISSCVSSLTNLCVLDLVGNSFSSIIPPQIKNLNHLTVLNLAKNKIFGQILTSYSKLQNLKHLDLHSRFNFKNVQVDLDLSTNWIFDGVILTKLLGSKALGILNLSKRRKTQLAIKLLMR